MNFKELGNQAIQKQNFKEAVEYYTKGLEKEPLNAILLANRSMAYLKLENFNNALKDAKKSIEIDPKYIKAYLRLSNAQFELGFYEECLDTIEKGFEVEKNNETLIQVKSKCEEKLGKYWDKDYKPEKVLETPKIISQIFDFYSNLNLEGEKLDQFNQSHIDYLLNLLYQKITEQNRKNISWILSEISGEFTRQQLRNLVQHCYNYSIRSLIEKIFVKNFNLSLPIIKYVMKKSTSLEFEKILFLIYKEKEEYRKIVLDTISDTQKKLGDYWASLAFYHMILFTNDLSLLPFLKKHLKVQPHKSNLFYKIIKKYNLNNEYLNDNFMKKCSFCGQVSFICKKELKQKQLEWKTKSIENVKKNFETKNYGEALKFSFQNYCFGEESKTEKLLKIKSLILSNLIQMALYEITQLKPNDRKELLNLININQPEKSNKLETKVTFAWENHSLYQKEMKEKGIQIVNDQYVISKKSCELFYIIDDSIFEVNVFESFYVYQDILILKNGPIFTFESLKNQKEIKTFKLPHYTKTKEYSFNGKYLCLWRENSNCLWFEIYDYNTLQLEKEIFGPFKNPLRENFTHFMTQDFLFASNTEGVYKFKLNTGELIETFIFSTIDELYNEKILKIEVHDIYLFVSNPNGIQIWNHENGLFIRQIFLKEDIISFKYFYDYLLVQTSKGLVFYEIQTGTFEFDIETDIHDIYTKDFEHYSIVYGISKSNLKQYFIPKTKDLRDKKCSFCQKLINSKKCCGKCFQNYYCSRECQISDWNSLHKTICVPVKLSKNFK